jgi:hypothetical protein
MVDEKMAGLIMGEQPEATSTQTSAAQDLGAQVQSLLAQTPSAKPPPTGAETADLAKQVESLLAAGENAPMKPTAAASVKTPEPTPGNAANTPASGGEKKPGGENPKVTTQEEKPAPNAGFALRLASVLSKPLDSKPRGVRVAVGVIAVNTLILAGILWAWVILRPREATPGKFDFSSGDLPAVPSAEGIAPRSSAPKSENGKPDAKHAGAKSETSRSPH